VRPLFFGLSPTGARRFQNTRTQCCVHQEEVFVMLAVIGNVLAGIGIVSLFTATLRLTKVK
jgi:hypothetical protein